MGSKHALSNGNEVEELTNLMVAFEEMNRFPSAIVLYVVERRGRHYLLAGIGRKPAEPMEQVLHSWDSHHFVYEVHEQVTLAAVAMRLLYGLDHTLADAEWEKTKPKKA